MAEGGALDQTAERSKRVDSVDSRSTGSHQMQVFKIESYNGPNETRGVHLDRRIKIQRERSNAFYNAH